jgi:hypothetical protein
MSELDLTALWDSELDDLARRVGEERWNRKCPEFLSGSPGCDKGKATHDVHGFDAHDNAGHPIRVTWKRKED